MNYFTDENIIEPLVRMYDFEYSQYVLNLPFDCGFKLYLKCIDNMKENLEKETENKIWDLWRDDRIHGNCKLNFSDYLEKMKVKTNDSSLDKDTKEEEEKRIFMEVEEHRKNMKFLN